MIVREILEDNPDLVRSYSDKGMLIHGGMPEGDYAEAIDPVSLDRQYVETDIPIPKPEEPEDGDAEEQ